MIVLRLLVVAAVAALVLEGCSSRGGIQDPSSTYPASSRRSGGTGSSRYGHDGSYGEPGAAYGNDRPGAGDASGVPDQRIIYFLYDSDEILPEYQSIVSAHASYLAAHPGREAVLEGHADERGSPEYNIALGERRAKAVLRMLQLKGVGDGQVQVVSYGEEKPSEAGHDEAAWDRNRRVEITYSGR